MSMHQAIADELKILQQLYPDKNELTLDEFADYLDISRHYATQYINREKITHKRISRNNIRVPLPEFAFYLAQKRMVNGRPLKLTPEDMKKRRGYTFDHV